MSNGSNDYTGASHDLNREYKTLLEELRVLQAEWHSVASRKAALEASVASATAQSDAVEPIRCRLFELREECALLNDRNEFIQLQIEEAKELYKRACEKSSVLVGDTLEEKEKLEEEYMRVMRFVDQFDPNLQEDAALLRAALAEQRVEMRVLQEMLDAVKESIVPDYVSEPLQNSRALLTSNSNPCVEIQMDDVFIPVPHGRLRLLTGPRGDGLQQLRDRHKVTASVVCFNDMVAVRLRGHKAGVENCGNDIRRVLSLQEVQHESVNVKGKKQQQKEAKHMDAHSSRKAFSNSFVSS
ncbi:hypothetical protein MOQ_002066 [Trypanosoma cruzi marinkellei]|uniref:K Homology domain-containing protein n=1 Tax=Trypanosoma cruzi marinkellei TaxID=85056 RepID=K2NRY7_TRYCR|nr:hypothetical protein MOQ_002066 [Trypanosoma cruzi marinkellei]